MTRILHVGKFFPPVPGGMEVFLKDLVLAQAGQGDEVFVLVHGTPLDQDPAWLQRVPVRFNLAFAPISPGFPLALAQAIQRWRPEVLHLHLPNLSALAVLGLPGARNLPWVIHWHADVVPSRIKSSLRLAYPFYRPLEQALLARSQRIIVTSPPYLASSEALQGHRSRCRVVPLGVDICRLPPAISPLPALPWQPGLFRVLAIGRLTYYKGFDTLIRAVGALSGVQLIIVGEGGERPGLEALIRQSGAGERIELLGEVDDARRNLLLQTCDLFCLPSRERTEAFGVVLMEAMAYGRPILASRIPGSGVAWVVETGLAGKLVEVDDGPGWQKAIVQMMEQPALRQELGTQGPHRFQEKFSITRVAAKVTEVYRQLLGTVEPPGHGRVLIVIPAKNEAESLGQVLAGLRQEGFLDVLVVNDGSEDETVAVARAGGARVLSPPLAQGAWGAMQTGIRYALSRGFDQVVTMDADGQHEPAHVRDLLAAGEQADVVIGAFPERGSALRLKAWAFFRMLTGFGIEDLTSGFRYYRLRACQILADDEATLLDYQDIGVLLLLRRAGLCIQEVPVVMYPRQAGASRIFASWWQVGRYMLETTLLCLAKWRPRYIFRRD